MCPALHRHMLARFKPQCGSRILERHLEERDLTWALLVSQCDPPPLRLSSLMALFKLCGTLTALLCLSLGASRVSAGYAADWRYIRNGRLMYETGLLTRKELHAAELVYECVCMCVCMYVCVYECVCVGEEHLKHALWRKRETFSFIYLLSCSHPRSPSSSSPPLSPSLSPHTPWPLSLSLPPTLLPFPTRLFFISRPCSSPRVSPCLLFFFFIALSH